MFTILVSFSICKGLAHQTKTDSTMNRWMFLVVTDNGIMSLALRKSIPVFIIVRVGCGLFIEPIISIVIVMVTSRNSQ